MRCKLGVTPIDPALAVHCQTPGTNVPRESGLTFYSGAHDVFNVVIHGDGDRMEIGYARTSTIEQVAGFEAQRRNLIAAGCKKVFAEQVSSVAEREQLMAALDYLRDGDVLTVTKLDRIARSMRDLMEIVHRIEEKGAGLRSWP